MRDPHSAATGNPGPDEVGASAAIRASLARQLDAPAADASDPPVIPDHTLLCRIGEGACGEVWLARSALGTLRAVKIVHRSRFKEDRPYEREFQGILKYEPISRTHEGLVQVLHAGRSDLAGCFYYVMELADADEEEMIGDGMGGETHASIPARTFSPASYRPRTLRSELSRRQRLPPSEAAQLTLRLARALAYLHEQGLVHRDIKPSNVIFVSGRPKLADIGLVTDVGSSHSFVGTEGFIPPEGPGTPKADLYGLGKLLYELATGRDRLDFPLLPAGILKPPDGEAILELNEVMTRACAPDPQQRYHSASELEVELNLFLAGRSLRRARTIERGLARLKRIAFAACVVLAFTTVALWFSKREQWQALERAHTESRLRERAEAAERRTEQQLYTALLEQARAHVRSGELGQRVRALDAIRRAASISNSVELRREVLAALALPDLRFERELMVGAGNTFRRLDPSFDRIAIGHGRGPVEVRAVADDRLLATLPPSTNQMAYDATWSHDGRFLSVKRVHDSMGYTNDLEIWAVHEPRQVLLVKDLSAAARCFHPHKPQLLTADTQGSVVLWDLEDGRELSRTTFEETPVHLAYSPDGDRVATAHRRSNGWGVAIHRAADGALLASQVLSNLIASLVWHPAGQWLALADHGGAVHLLDARTGELRYLGMHKAEASTAVFSPQGDYLLTGGWERELICWDMRTMRPALTLALNSYVAQFSADGRSCALLTLNSVQLHAFEYPAAHRHFPESLGPRLRHATFSPDGRWLAASADGRVGVWDLRRNAPGTVTETGANAQLFWTPDGEKLYGSCRHQDFFCWRVQSPPDPTAPPLLQRVPLRRPDGFVSLQLASNRILWTGHRGALFTGHEEAPAADAPWADTIQGITGTSPDGRWLAICRTYSPVLHLYRLPEMVEVARLTNRANVEGFSFLPFQDEIGVTSRGHLEFWSTATWERTRAATNFIGIPDIGMLAEPAGRRLWLARDYRTAGLFDARTLAPVYFLPTGMFPLALSPDGNHLAVSVEAQRLQIWELASVRKYFAELGLDWSDP